MDTLNEPQVWTLIGVFAVVMLGAMTLSTTLLGRIIKVSMEGVEKSLGARIDGLRGEMNAKFEAVDLRFEAMDAKFDARFEAMDARFEAMDAKIGRVEDKLTHLDRDVQALSRRVFDDERG
ncbi:hypothetical protein J4H92_06895 [Leucobacter weissii]|uniref:Uncharacterized protein n=1 Tax=Leucobacter weissii TaxID=1983706 RepID=A0A939MIR5_9MICO|nr:hypothetical protein [Leucobacter weissii]MBO1901679.1 hypothetical protein [Leucobacter weissii]